MDRRKKNEKDCRNFDCNGVRTIFPLVELKECKTIKCLGYETRLCMG